MKIKNTRTPQGGFKQTVRNTVSGTKKSEDRD